ncbi:hypothetical protein FBU31_006757, partial [Coemansia sp. 'formosensis']
MLGSLRTSGPHGRHWARLALGLLGVTAIYAAVAAHPDMPGDCTPSLLSDCFRLGMVWPVVNLLLAAILIIQGWWRSSSGQVFDHNSGAHHHHAPVSYTDNRRRMRVAAIIVSLVGAGIATNAVFALDGVVHQTYWLSQLLFSSCLPLALIAGAHCSVPVLVQLLLASLAEPYFAFFTGAHIHEPLLATTHSRSILASAAVAALAAFIQLSTHRRSALHRLPENQCELKEAAEYRTPLTRVRLEHEPKTVSPERAL